MQIKHQILQCTMSVILLLTEGGTPKDTRKICHLSSPAAKSLTHHLMRCTSTLQWKNKRERGETID